MTTWDDDICDEVARADDGCILGNPQSGYAYTERALKERQKRHNAFVAIRRPQLTLDPDLIALAKDSRISEPPLLYFGLIFDRKFLEQCVSDKGLMIGDGQPTDASSRECHLLDTVVEYLERQCKFPLRLTYPLHKDQNHCIIALDDTRRLRSTTCRSWEKRIVPVLRILRRELGLRPNTKAKWWWGYGYGDTYLCSLPKYNPPQVNAATTWVNLKFPSCSSL